MHILVCLHASILEGSGGYFHVSRKLRLPNRRDLWQFFGKHFSIHMSGRILPATRPLKTVPRYDTDLPQSMSHPVNEHTAAWTKPSNGPNLVVIPRTYALVSSLWVQLHATQLHPAPRLSVSVAAAPRHYIRLRLCWSYSARTRLLQCGATPKRQRSRDRWTLPSPTKPPRCPPSVHLVSAATRHRLLLI